MSQVDDLIAKLLNSSEPKNLTTPILDEKYQMPVKVGKAGLPIDDKNKPWIIGTFIPKGYINPKHTHGHPAVDYAAPKNTPIHPIASGKVIEVREYPKGGKTCKISHENGDVVSYYAHMHQTHAQLGSLVNQNSVIGTIGNTGSAFDTAPHVHLEVKVNGVHINPQSIMGKQVGSLSQKPKTAQFIEDILEKYSYSRLDQMQKLAEVPNINIGLNGKEKEIFSLLMNVIQDKAPGTTLRAAGGWVRDKLLGKDSHDIDIAVDNMSGLSFAKLVFEWMKEHKMPVHNIAKIEANPEANKNLETAILPIFDIPIDFVQLRKDTYNEDSRNPEIEVGVSPEEDAQRRDLTINAIFYNINEGKVEDFVGGIEDLKKGIARTPIDPLRTYLEDPLRILRAVRFAAKYNLDLDPALIGAAKNSKVRDAFKNKISRERIWSELVGQQEKDGWKRGLMIGPNFDRAAELLGVLGLRDLLLVPTKEQVERAIEKQKKNDPKTNIKWEQGFGTWELNQNNPHHDLDVWNHTVAALKYLAKIHASNLSEGKKMQETDEIVRNLAMLFHDIGKCDACSKQDDPRGYNTYHEHELSSAVIAEEILTDLKAPNDLKNRIVALVKNHMRLHTLPADSTGSGLRRVVRDIGQDWPNLVEMSKADAMGKIMAQQLPEKYDTFAKIIDQYLTNTGGKAEMPPPLNGNEVMEILGLKPGAAVGKVVKALKEKMLENPELSKEEATSFVKTLTV